MRLSYIALFFMSACGYSIGFGHFPGKVRSVAVGMVAEDGVDIDAAGLLGSVVRRAVATHPGASLVADEEAEARLKIKLVNVSGGLAPMSDPGSRAAQYRARITITAQLIHRNGTTLWKSNQIIGQADYLSVPDDIEALDGRRRTALKEAAVSAGDQLMTALVYRR
jgi:outer membrane lipopolysaccharide assembly protein LptE/RlpB